MSRKQSRTSAEMVRRRPGIYIGPVTGAKAVERLIVESVAFLLSTSLPGRPRRIEILLNPEGGISITDARPKATEAQRRGLRAKLNLMVTNLYAGVRYEYPGIGESLAVGLPVVNFLSSSFQVSFNYGGKPFSRSYERGVPVGDFVERRQAQLGTVLRFVPDASILGTGAINAASVLRRLAKATEIVPVVVEGLGLAKMRPLLASRSPLCQGSCRMVAAG